MLNADSPLRSFKTVFLKKTACVTLCLQVDPMHFISRSLLSDGCGFSVNTPSKQYHYIINTLINKQYIRK